jgi:tripartite-type tricarboxylate transporter receptor subunit TctC
MASRRLVWAAAVAFLCAAGATFGQAFPTKKVTLIVPFAPGGPTDVVSRAVMEQAEKQWGQPVVIENRPGASGMAAVEPFTRQPADGYTMFFHGNTPLTAHFFMKDIPFNQADMRPAVAFGGSSYVLTVHPSLNVKTLKELIAAAKAKPKSIN